MDFRYSISRQDFTFDTAERGWVSKEQKAEFPYDELIYSWSIHLPEGEGMRLYVKAGLGDGESSPWLYAGYWGSVKLDKGREVPKFDKGMVDYDTLKLTEKASSFIFKVESAGEKELTTAPELHVVITDNKPDDALVKKYLEASPMKQKHAEKIFDMPLRLQQDSKGNPMPDHCQSAALATAMEYFGKKVELENIVPYTTDSEYGIFGIWPRTIQAAVDNGFDAYIDRFRNWDDVRKTLAEGKVILCSITMPKDDVYIAPPYPSMSGHIVALNGITGDGRVVVTDSALGKNKRGYLCQWKAEDFEKIWMRNKGGVGMVICPPKDFKGKYIAHLGAFPKRDYKPPVKEDTKS